MIALELLILLVCLATLVSSVTRDDHAIARTQAYTQDLWEQTMHMKCADPAWGHEECAFAQLYRATVEANKETTARLDRLCELLRYETERTGLEGET